METPRSSRSEDFGGIPSEGSNDGLDKKRKNSTKSKSTTAEVVDLVSRRENNRDKSPLEATARVAPQLSELFSRKPADDEKDEAVIFSSSRRNEEVDESDEDEPMATIEIESDESELGPLEAWSAAATYVQERGVELKEKVQSLSQNDNEVPVIAANAVLIENLSQQIEQAVHARDESEEDTAVPPATIAEAVDAAFDLTIKQQALEDIDTTVPLEVERQTSPDSLRAEAAVIKSTLEDEALYSSSETPNIGVISASAARGGGAPTHMSGPSMSLRSHAAPISPGIVQSEAASATIRPEKTADWLAPAALGATIGYWVGRRHGQNKTERHFAPEKKKLETEVRTLLSTITAKEAQLRQLVRAQIESKVPARSASLGREALPFTPKNESPVHSSHERPIERTVGQSPAETPAPRIAEASVSAPGRSAERTVIAAPMSSAEIPHSRSAGLTKAETAVRQAVPVETMDKKELLEVSATITIGSGNLRSVYERHEVSEQGLRRLVAEHQKGGDIGHALKDEMLKQELHFERLDEPDDSVPTHERQAVKAATVQNHTSQPILPVWTMTPPQPVLTNSERVDPVLFTSPSTNVRPRSNHTIQPILVVANVAAFIVLAILLTVFLIIRF